MDLFGNIADFENEIFFYGKIVVDKGKKTIKDIIKLGKEKKDENYIIPGFVDSHIHIESSMLTPSEFSKIAVPHGTIAVVADPHEIANVAGIDGVKSFYNNSLNSAMSIFWAVPSCVPASEFEESNFNISLKDQKDLFKLENFVALGEVMNYPGVIADDPILISKLENAKLNNKIIDGHTPGLSGDGLVKYFKSGVSTDHECSTIEEAKKRIKLGVKIQIREGSAAKNFEELYPLIESHNDNCFFCSDDLHPDHLFNGHINLLVKRAIEKGTSPIKCLKVASYNPIKHYKLPIGLLKKDDSADFLVIDNLIDFNIKQTFIKAEEVTNKINTTEQEIVEIKEHFYSNNLNSSDMEVKILDKENVTQKENLKIRVIGAFDKSLLTENLLFSPKVEKNKIVQDLDRDLLKIVVLNRYKKSNPIIGFIKGFKFKKGALATSIAHDSHNIIAIGTNDTDLVNAVNLLNTTKGGISVCSEELNIKEVMPLNIGGIVSSKPAKEVSENYIEINNNIKKLGSDLIDPLMTLSFMSLSVIPSLKITAKGIFDSNKFEIIELLKKE